MAIDEDDSDVPESGKIYSFGDNAWGQLGLGHNKPVSKPTRVKALVTERVITASCGRSHTVLATESGKLYSFGACNEGQLGFDSGSQDRVAVPTQFLLPEATGNVKTVYAGGNHSACLTDFGEVFIWGCGSEGQLGLGSDIDKQMVPAQLSLGDQVVQVACGYYHTMFVTATGYLYACGETDSGKLGWSPTCDVDNFVPQRVSGLSDKVISVSCGHNHTVVVTERGDVYAFGDGSNGQLGCGNTCLEDHSPQLISWSGQVKIVHVSCGEGHTAFISDSGVLYTCGDGRHGKLALGDDNLSNHFRPTSVKRFGSFFVEQALCGGCHTIVIARPQLNGEQLSNHELIDYPVKDRLSAVAELIKNGDLSNSIDMSGSISARIRRRQKVPDLTSTQPNLPCLSLYETTISDHEQSTVNLSEHISDITELHQQTFEDENDSESKTMEKELAAGDTVVKSNVKKQKRAFFLKKKQGAKNTHKTSEDATDCDSNKKTIVGGEPNPAFRMLKSKTYVKSSPEACMDDPGDISEDGKGDAVDELENEKEAIGRKETAGSLKYDNEGISNDGEHEANDKITKSLSTTSVHNDEDSNNVNQECKGKADIIINENNVKAQESSTVSVTSAETVAQVEKKDIIGPTQKLSSDIGDFVQASRLCAIV